MRSSLPVPSPLCSIPVPTGNKVVTVVCLPRGDSVVKPKGGKRPQHSVTSQRQRLVPLLFSLTSGLTNL